MDGPVDVVLPVKDLPHAKSRLVGVSETLDASPAGRRRAHQDLALALATDTLDAVLATAVRAVVVVTADPRVRDLAAARSRRVTVVDDPAAGLDAAVRHGASHLRRREGRAAAVAALQADLPALRPAELDAALHAALAATGAARGAGSGTAGPAHPACFVADHTGTGTTMLVTAAGRTPGPRFGPGSAAAHAASGALALEGDWPGLRTDVDTPADLARVLALGAGPATTRWPGAGPGGSPDPSAAHERCAASLPRG